MKTKLLFLFFLLSSATLNTIFAQNCIFDLSVEQDDCTPFGEYNAFVSFEHSPNVDSVSIFFDGNFFGNHSTEFQPIVLSPIPFIANGNNIHNIEVVSTTSSACSDSTSFEGICNFGTDDCLSEIFFVDAFCIDSILQFEINYTFLNPVSEGHIYVNDEFIANATIGENQTLSFSVDNINLQSVYEVVVRDAEFPACGDTLITQVAPCTVNCTSDFDISTSCNLDGTFNLGFFHQDSFDTKLYLNNEFISRIIPGQTNNPFLIEEIPMSTSASDFTLTTCLVSNPTCCRTVTFEQPACEPCNTNLELNEVFCEGIFPIFDITYNVENLTSGAQFIVNGAVVDQVVSDQSAQIFLNPEIINDQGTYIIILQDSIAQECADTLIVNDFFCEECIVETSNLVTECLDGTDNYLVQLDIFNSGNTAVSEYFIIHQTGQTFGPFSTIGTNGAVQASFEVSTNLQGQFQIFDPNEICNAFFTTEVDCNPNTDCSITNVLLDHECLDSDTFEAFIQFDHNNVIGGNVEILNINGMSLGQFDVNQQPITIQIPTTGQGPETFGIVIINPIDSSCVAESNIIGVDCGFTPACSISDVALDFECLDEDNYQVFLTFEHTGIEGDTVEITNASGNSLGFFDVNQQPIVIDVDNSNGANSSFGVFIENPLDPVCFAGSSLIQVDCSTTEPCEVAFIEILNTECNPDGTYNLTASYSITNGNNDFIDVSVNGGDVQFLDNTGTVVINNITPRPNSDFDIIEICLNDNANCCLVNEYLQPDCSTTNDCAIEAIEYEVICLDSMGSFMVNLFFNHDNTSGEVIVTNFAGASLGQFGVDQQPIAVGPFTLDDLNDDGIGFVICDAQIDGCCQETFVDDIPCMVNTEPCEVEFIEIISTNCNSDGTYTLTASYSITNGNNDFIDVSVNGGEVQFLDNSGTVVITNITPRPNSDFDIIEICLNDNANCCLVNEYLQPDCSTTNDCAIGGIEHEVICLDSTGSFMVNLFFNHDSTSGEVIVTNFVGESLGQFGVDQQPITVGPFTQDDLNDDGIGFVICDAELDDCCAEIFVSDVPCMMGTESCAVEFIEVISTECNSDGTYTLTASYNITNGNNDFIDVSVNGGDVQFLDNTGTVVITNITPRPNSDFDIIEICLNDNANCCLANEYLQPDCSTTTNDCAIGGIEHEVICLDSTGSFMVNLFFNHDSTSGEVIVTNFVGESLGQFGVDQQPITVGPFTQDDLNDDGIGFVICDAELDDCCAEIFVSDVPCMMGTESCAVEFIEVISTECDGDSTYTLTAMYSITNGNNDFIDVSVNGGPVQTLDNTGSIMISNITPRPNDDFDIIELCVANNPNCCQVIEYLQPSCSTNTEECEIEILDVGFFCENEGIFFVMDVESNTMNDYLIFVNGIELGTGNPANLNIEVGPIDTNADGFYMIQVIDAEDATCRADFELIQAFCPDEGCNIGELLVDISCQDEETFTAIISFPYDADHQEGVSISGNGTDYGTFDGNTQPIFIEGLVASANENWEFVVIDNQVDSCQSSIEIGEINCSDEALECIIENIEVFNLECIGDGEYSMSVSFTTGTNANIPFSFLVNGEPITTATTNTLPLNVVGVIPNDTIDIDILTICLDEFDGECCVDFVYEQPACLFSSVDVTLIDGVSMSPNPTTNTLYINDIPNDIIGMNVIDNLGRKIEQITSQPNVALDVSSYQNGIYTVQFFTQDNRVMSRRFVKM